MTNTDRPVTRETFARVQGRTLVVRLDRHTIYVRQKGRRWGYSLDYEVLYSVGAKLEDKRRRAEKAERKKK